jgi:hypothetical protein
VNVAGAAHPSQVHEGVDHDCGAGSGHGVDKDGSGCQEADRGADDRGILTSFLLKLVVYPEGAGGQLTGRRRRICYAWMMPLRMA